MDLGPIGAFGSGSTLSLVARCKVSQGASAEGGGLLDAAASLLSAPAADPWADHLARVEIVEALAPSLGSCRITLGRGPAQPSVAIDDELSVELGFGDTLSAAFKGKVAAITDAGNARLDVVLVSPARLLAAHRQNASFEQQSLGDIVGLWASEVEVETGNVDTGPDYPFLAIDDRRSAWEWIAALAGAAGLLTWVDAEGKLNCTRVSGPAARTYRYGEDIVRLAFTERVAHLGEVTMTGEGAAGSQGSDAWCWLVKQVDGIQKVAGNGVPKRLYQQGVLRNLDAVSAAASSLRDRAESLCSEARVTVLGSPDVGVGSIFALAACPDDRGDGDYVVTRLRHRYDKARGFLTELVGTRA